MSEQDQLAAETFMPSRSRTTGLHERQSRTEADVANLTTQIGQLANVQASQSSNINKLTEAVTSVKSDVANLLEAVHSVNATQKEQWTHIEKWAEVSSTTKAQAGRVNVPQLAAYVGTMIVLVGGLFTLGIAPLAQKTDFLQLQLNQHMALAGHPGLVEWKPAVDTNLAILKSNQADNMVTIARLTADQVKSDKEQAEIKVYQKVHDQQIAELRDTVRELMKLTVGDEKEHVKLDAAIQVIQKQLETSTSDRFYGRDGVRLEKEVERLKDDIAKLRHP